MGFGFEGLGTIGTLREHWLTYAFLSFHPPALWIADWDKGLLAQEAYRCAEALTFEMLVWRLGKLPKRKSNSTNPYRKS